MSSIEPGTGWRNRGFTAALVSPFFVFPAVALAQQPDTVPQTLAPVITVTRESSRSPLDLPYAVSSTRPDSARPGQRHVLLEETLFLLPGVTVANRNNPTQDPRISIRGFGSRSAFGVRGVRVMRDGMPLTLPDGQTPMDYLDLESVGWVEAIRGSAAALYGNASGGVIDIHSAPAPSDPLAVRARGWGGSEDFQRWTASLGGTSGRFSYQGDVNRTTQDGERAYSRQRITNGYGRAELATDNSELSLQILGHDMPVAENPGSLTLAQFESSPGMADPSYVARRARKEVSQLQVGVQARRALQRGELLANVYGGTRDLYNPLTFAIVDVDRVSYGGGARMSIPVTFLGLDHTITLGADLQRQEDDRKNFANCNGVDFTGGDVPAGCVDGGSEAGAVELDQAEIVSGIGPYLRDEINFGERYRLDLGLRADYVKFEVRDNLITASDPDDSGERTLHAISPIVGLVARVTPLHSAYANVSTAFETPTATELGNHPDGSAGINPDLKPQYATTYEVGMKGIVFSGLQYDFALFDTEVRDELIPFEIPGGAGRRYFRNAGRTRRNGFEVGLNATVGAFDLGASYSFSHFRFRGYVLGGVSLGGNRIPGIPANQLQAAATWRGQHGLFATVEGLAQSNVFVDDGNSARSDGYTTVNLRLGALAAFGRPWISPVIGVRNLYDTRYAGSVSVNASGGKFYEPAPGRTVFAGLTLAAGRR